MRTGDWMRFGWNSNALPYNTFGYGLSIYIQSDGKIVVAGMFKTSEQYWQPAVWRFNANGLYDTSFGINGRVLLNSSLNSAMAVAGYRPLVAHRAALFVRIDQ